MSRNLEEERDVYMNDSSDFAALDAPESRKRRIALMLGMWNAVQEKGEWRWELTMRQGSYSPPKGWTSAARSLGLKAKGRRVTG